MSSSRSTGASTSRMRPFGLMSFSDAPGLMRLNARVQPEDHVRLIVVQPDGFHAADLDPGDLDAGAVLEAAHRRKIGRHEVAAPAQERYATQFNGKVPQCQDPEYDEDADGDVHTRALHALLLTEGGYAPLGTPPAHRNGATLS